MPDWKGQSLKFIRQVTRQPPKYESATEAMKASDVHHSGPPNIPGIYCWYLTDHPYGNVALHLGDDIVLGISPSGYPDMFVLTAEVLGTYHGWSQNIGPDHAD